MKPAFTWTIALGGLLLLAGAMAWATHSLMDMEQTQHRMAAEAAVQERERLALWRMESIAASLVVEESARPPEQYRTDPVHAPAISPASRIRLHFELDADGRIRSPQVVASPLKTALPDEPTFRLQELRTRLAEKAAPEQLALLGQTKPSRLLTTNGVWLSVANTDASPQEREEKTRVNPADPAKRQQDQPPVPAAPNYIPLQLPSTMKPREARDEQIMNNKKEAEMRSKAVGDLARSVAIPRQQTPLLSKMKKVDPLASADSDGQSSRSEVALEAEPTARNVASGRAAAAAPIASTASANQVTQERDRVTELTLGADAPQSDPPPSPAISDFRAFWIKDTLLLTRRVTQEGTSLVQGAWVDWPQLRSDLLAAVSDLFPAASLVAASSGKDGGTDLLASLPIRFLPGPLEIPSPPFWSPLKLSLATAWGCVFLASAAVAMVLRGMMVLSERRAAFVSAVTHELRTPLATFKLYSEMLADGLVSDPTKRQSYLETLTTEADRLGHLVENVLSYSRLERGKGSDGQMPITLMDLCRRVEPRLHQRAAAAGAQFVIQHGEVPGLFELSTDPSAVEQILFNLVDNACKYAGHQEVPAQIELVIERGSATLKLAVRDHGPGVSKAEAGKLFRPFHKSAREAAHTAPGVGLGLALCRRLARDLGGTLEIDPAWRQGASFVLTLPASARGSQSIL